MRSNSATLPRAESATLALFDVSGRRIASREVGSLGAGAHVVVLSPPGSLASGIYWVRLAQGSRGLGARCVVLR